jgi:hypothetical protein
VGCRVMQTSAGLVMLFGFLFGGEEIESPERLAADLEQAAADLDAGRSGL